MKYRRRSFASRVANALRPVAWGALLGVLVLTVGLVPAAAQAQASPDAGRTAPTLTPERAARLRALRERRARLRQQRPQQADSERIERAERARRARQRVGRDDATRAARLRTMRSRTRPTARVAHLTVSERIANRLDAIRNNHNRRIARLQRIIEVAREQGDEATVAQAQKLIERENAAFEEIAGPMQQRLEQVRQREQQRRSRTGTATERP